MYHNSYYNYWWQSTRLYRNIPQYKNYGTASFNIVCARKAAENHATTDKKLAINKCCWPKPHFTFIRLNFCVVWRYNADDYDLQCRHGRAQAWARGALALCKYLKCCASLSKVSIDEVFMHYFEKMSSAWLCPCRTPLGDFRPSYSSLSTPGKTVQVFLPYRVTICYLQRRFKKFLATAVNDDKF